MTTVLGLNIVLYKSSMVVFLMSTHDIVVKSSKTSVLGYLPKLYCAKYGAKFGAKYDGVIPL